MQVFHGDRFIRAAAVFDDKSWCYTMYKRTHIVVCLENTFYREHCLENTFYREH